MLSLVIYDIVPSCKSLMQDYTQPVALDKEIGQRDKLNTRCYNCSSQVHPICGQGRHRFYKGLKGICITFKNFNFKIPTDKRLKGGHWPTSDPLNNQLALPCFYWCHHHHHQCLPYLMLWQCAKILSDFANCYLTFSGTVNMSLT